VQRDILGNVVMQNWQKRWPIFQLLTKKHNDDQPIAIRLERLTKTITYWDNIHEIVKKTPQK
jgi:hypothetical protein